MKTFTTFNELDLPSPLKAALEKMSFLAPTPVQAASIPPALEGKDVLGTAQTGTGKTGAFGIPLLAKLYPNPGTKALILAPTRELAAQIHKVLTEMSHGMKLKGALMVGGESFYRQKADVKGGADFYVCTPGRLIDHLDAGLRLPKVCMLVLDEVDRMLDMGFAPQLLQIVPHIPKERQTLLFSATLPKEILAVAAKYLQDPVRVSIGATTQPIDRVKQESHSTTHLNKNELLLKHLADIKGRVLIFARTQHRTNKVFQLLERNKHNVVSLHGGRTQAQRKEALNGFRSGSHLVMVATDLAGRGIDVDDIECVINYDLPANREDYIHRIGRTARNGKSGRALNYLTPNDHEGRDIVSAPQPKSARPLPSAASPKQNQPGWQKGGWDKAGGRNRPAFQKRTPAEGYGKSFGAPRKPFEKRPMGERSFEKAGRPAFGAKRPPFGDRPQGPRSFGDRPKGPRTFGDRPQGPRSFGDRPKGPRNFGDRPQGPRSFGDRPQGPRSFGGGKSRPPFADGPRAESVPKGDAPFRAPGDRRPLDAENRAPRKPFKLRRPGGKPSFDSRPEGGPRPAFTPRSPMGPGRPRYADGVEGDPRKITFFRTPRGEKAPAFEGKGKRGPRPPFGAKKRSFEKPSIKG